MSTTRADDSVASEGDSALGFGLALAAYLIWGGLPLYLHALVHIPLPEVLAKFRPLADAHAGLAPPENAGRVVGQKKV